MITIELVSTSNGTLYMNETEYVKKKKQNKRKRTEKKLKIIDVSEYNIC